MSISDVETTCHPFSNRSDISTNYIGYEEPDHEVQMMAKLTSSLQHADREDLKLLFKLAKRLAQHA